MDPKYLRDDLWSKLAHASEECGELIKELGDLTAALGKTMRWGPDSYNPEIPVEERETNLEWVRRATAGVLREQEDLRKALTRLELHAENYS